MLTVIQPLHSFHRESRADAALRVRAIQQRLARSGGNILGELGQSFEPEIHYPPGEFRDDLTHAHFFYHAHAAAPGRPQEHGHFHTFLGREALPSGMYPHMFPEMALAPLGPSGRAADGSDSGPRFPGVYSHLIGVGIDRDGTPNSLFTTNRWVTGETWFAGEHVTAMLPLFRFEEQPPLLGEWLGGVLHVLRHVAQELIQERDARITDWRRRRTRQIHVLDDRRLEIVSERRIDFQTELDAALSAAD